MKSILAGFVVLAMCLLCANGHAVVREDFAKIKEISDRVVKACSTDEQKVIELSHFVYNNIRSNPTKGVSPNTQMSTTDRLDIGVGWCNHQVAVFMRLAEQQKISTRMIYLLNNEGTASPHTIGEALIDGRWVIVDPMLDFEIRNKDGKLASRHDIVKDQSILMQSKVFKEMIDTNPEAKKWIDYFINPGYIAYELIGKTI